MQRLGEVTLRQVAQACRSNDDCGECPFGNIQAFNCYEIWQQVGNQLDKEIEI